MRLFKSASPLPLILLVALLACPSESVSQEFKIETSIYAKGQKRPVAQNITLFKDRLIVDLKIDDSTPPKILETKVYDSSQKIVALLDHSRRIRLEISEHRLLQMVDGLRRDISQRKDLKFLIDESFDESQPKDTDKLTLFSPSIQYTVRGSRPANDQHLKMHSEFLDIFTRLNASDPGGFPPFARLKLNESIKKMGWIPASVEIEMKPNSLVTKGLIMKSEHVLINGLSTEDDARIRSAKNQWIGYRAVELLEFRNIEKTANAKSGNEPTTHK